MITPVSSFNQLNYKPLHNQNLQRSFVSFKSDNTNENNTSKEIKYVKAAKNVAEIVFLGMLVRGLYKAVGNTNLTPEQVERLGKCTDKFQKNIDNFDKLANKTVEKIKEGFDLLQKKEEALRKKYGE